MTSINPEQIQVNHITLEEDCLSSIESNFICERDGCNRTFKSLPVLKFHQSQYHDHQKVPKKVKLNHHIEERFHCPVKDCIYYYSSYALSRYFAKLQYLKQHYLKVHSVRSFPCNQCGKSFSTKSFLRAHQQYCDLDLICSCQQNFSSITALQTHVKRMGHEAEVLAVYARRLSDKKGRKPEESSLIASTRSQCLTAKGGGGSSSLSTGTSPILPRSQPSHMVAALALSELAFAGLQRIPTVEVGVQTDSPATPRRLSRKASSPIRSRDFQNLKRKQTTEMETQTQLTNLKGKTRRKGGSRKVSKCSMATDTKGFQSFLPHNAATSSLCMEEESAVFSVPNPSYIVYEGTFTPLNHRGRKDDLGCSRDLIQEQFNSSGTQTSTSGANFQMLSSSEVHCLPYDFYQRESKDVGNDSISCPVDTSVTADGQFARKEISIQADEDVVREVIQLEEEAGGSSSGMSSSRFSLLYGEESLSPSGRLTPPLLSRRPPSLATSPIRSSSIETQTDHDVFLSTHVIEHTEEDMVDADIILTSTETQTERETGYGNGRESPSLWCTSETQTCEDFSDIEPFLCSTIHTQTIACGEHHDHSSELFPELAHFTSDTHTQTGLDDPPSLVTTHTQTLLPKELNSNC